jgi:hypothetical protein
MAMFYTLLKKRNSETVHTVNQLLKIYVGFNSGDGILSEYYALVFVFLGELNSNKNQTKKVVFVPPVQKLRR